MSSTEISNGVYRISLRGNECISGANPDAPLHLLPQGSHEHQLWEVKKRDDNQYLITLKGKPELGVSYPKGAQGMQVVTLSKDPRPFRLQPAEGNYNMIPVEVEDDRLVMFRAPFQIYPPMVGLLEKRNISETGWRFERA
ncbi:hypothetical protein EX895_003480 [Sporisorium graminicola]|uniref:Ricin B lectin domain-containing protein n=1 Tax=Sporisorium graminicola TaxID=280036 RepID=A0A4U7KTN7_9BASI|nr:hypothetical protein EX895_003480 [Sporisorium graminicola]TKY87466.1 hypothetical protein EX895_003480 [Sporisorium graminicola]